MIKERVRVIQRSRGIVSIDLPELFRYRELLLFLAWRDIVTRYRQTAIGIGWALIRPLLTMIVFTVVFGGIANLSSEGVPYPVMTYAGVLPWSLFATSVTMSSQSVVAGSQMVTKVYFPRLVLPASAVLTSTVDFLIAFVILIALMAWYGIVPGVAVLYLPLFVLLAIAASFGASLWLSALDVRYRDVKYAIPFLTQLGIFVSPVGFSTTVIPEQWRLLYSLNPMVGVIDGFRWGLLGSEFTPDWTGLALSTSIVVIMLTGGALFFRKMERTFADVI